MSIYATIASIEAYEPVGAPWIYRGSHILPAETDPRGGVIGLALIPSHITRDGRDDQPEDGAPWPWLRLSVDTGGDPAVLLNPAQARHLAAELVAWAAESQQPGGHVYLSTGCLHNQHAYCQADTGLSGAKTPAACKWCAAPCNCHCHTKEQQP